VPESLYKMDFDTFSGKFFVEEKQLSIKYIKMTIPSLKSKSSDLFTAFALPIQMPSRKEPHSLKISPVRVQALPR
jgi:hypothetical protein